MNYELWAHRCSHPPFFINHNRFIVYLINGNFLLQYTIYIIYRFLFLYYILYWQSFKDQLLRFFSKAGAKLLLFRDMTKFLGRFFELSSQLTDFQYPLFWAVSRTSFSISQNTPSFFAKADAKLLLFYDMNKFLCKFFIFSS